jgi:hypothetical protein
MVRYCIQIIVKEKKSNHDHNFQVFWDMIQKTTLWLFGVEVGSEIQTINTENLFNKIVAESFQNLEKNIDIWVQEDLESLLDTTRKEPLYVILKLKCQQYRTKEKYWRWKIILTCKVILQNHWRNQTF